MVKRNDVTLIKCQKFLILPLGEEGGGCLENVNNKNCIYTVYDGASYCGQSYRTASQRRRFKSTDATVQYLLRRVKRRTTELRQHARARRQSIGLGPFISIAPLV